MITKPRPFDMIYGQEGSVWCSVVRVALYDKEMRQAILKKIENMF